MTSSRRSKDESVSKIKTGSFERRLSLTKAGLLAGTRIAGSYTASLFSSKEKRQQARRKALSKQATFLADELGKLKGSVVKIGQVMALYGEHFLPVEVTEALHTLEDKTVALDWPIIRGVLFEQLGAEKMSLLEIEEDPIGTASLGQVHRAKIKSSGKLICLKVQYPGVAAAVDADLDAVAQLLRLARVVSVGPDFDEWLEEVREMMHREVNYRLEADTTHHFGQLLADDSRFVVPEVFYEFSSDHVIATSFEQGESVSSQLVKDLPQSQRNFLGKTALELFLKELFCWHEIQTDPNFGNYRIRLGNNGSEADCKIVLLDFGAVQKYPESFINPVCDMIYASYHRDLRRVIKGAISLKFMHDDWPQKILDEFGEVCIAVLEPLAKEKPDIDDNCFNGEGEYRWKASDLPSRIAKRATMSAISRYFKIPPKEFVFLNRKLVGVYTFVAVLDAEFNGRDILESYLTEYEKASL